MQIKSIVLIDGDLLIKNAWLKALSWAAEYDITNDKDIQKMTHYQNVLNIISVYKENKNRFVVFFYKEDTWVDVKKKYLKKVSSVLPTFISRYDLSIGLQNASNGLSRI